MEEDKYIFKCKYYVLSIYLLLLLTKVHLFYLLRTLLVVPHFLGVCMHELHLWNVVKCNEQLEADSALHIVTKFRAMLEVSGAHNGQIVVILK